MAPKHAAALTGFTAAVLLVGAANATGTVSAGPLQRGTTLVLGDPLAPTAVCTVTASRPERSITGGDVKGSASQICSGNFVRHTVRATIDQYRGLGVWRKKSDGPRQEVTAPDHDVWGLVRWRCAQGTGNQRYRIKATGTVTDANGRTVTGVDYSPSERFTCPT